ncbi:MAG: hypothetical protein ACLP1Y_15335, partial [Candidatus Acidiferrales bacterium]
PDFSRKRAGNSFWCHKQKVSLMAGKVSAGQQVGKVNCAPTSAVKPVLHIPVLLSCSAISQQFPLETGGV